MSRCELPHRVYGPAKCLCTFPLSWRFPSSVFRDGSIDLEKCRDSCQTLDMRFVNEARRRMGQRQRSTHGMSLMGGEPRPNAIGPWDLLDVSEEPEAAGMWTTVPTTGAGTDKGGAAWLHCQCSLQYQKRESVWDLRKVGRARDCEWVTSDQAKLGLGSQVCRAAQGRCADAGPTATVRSPGPLMTWVQCRHGTELMG